MFHVLFNDLLNFVGLNGVFSILVFKSRIVNATSCLMLVDFVYAKTIFTFDVFKVFSIVLFVVGTFLLRVVIDLLLVLFINF